MPSSCSPDGPRDPDGAGDPDLDDALAIARAVAAEAAALLRGARPSEIRTKSDPTDLVTEWDTRSEDLIRSRLAVLTPSIPMIGEEGGGDVTAARRWVVDPIDGTVNFAHGLPLWTVSIALEQGDQLEVGVVTAPALDWTFAARLGGGAQVTRPDGTRPLAVSAIADLGRAMLASGFPYDRATSPDNNFAEWDHFQRKAGACRRLGSAALDLCLVAAGEFDGYWERKLSPWDIAAGALIVTEAGGRVTDTLGRGFRSRSGELVASNGAIHDAIVAELAVVTAARHRSDRRLG
jgi:myo-inositol-1(or 4)-monophosphatase